MATTQAPPPYQGAPPATGAPPYGAPQYEGGAPIIIMQQQQQQQQQQQVQQTVIVQARGTNHGLCCLICLLTGGFSLPCWIYACITD
ncbi:unnamed protein product [Rotaria sp. Silwood1]|nr:unnamed protein product [Rotaria sp. Silwood1]CAF1681972.1 unnamed protein product [Rotaria sp. Silwood1]